MPRSIIYPISDGNEGKRRVEVHWQRDGGVQIATAEWDGEGDRDLDHSWTSTFVNLSRTDVNHLIRQERIARNAAWGKDE